MCSSNDAPPDPRTKIELRDLRVSRGGRPVLQVDALDVPERMVTAVIGPNGSGKSTLLAALQLLVRPDGGRLLLDGAPMDADVLATRRRMASVFQEALLLSTGVRKNVETALGLHRVPRAQRRARADRWLARFGVAHLADRHARALSGGEAQRVSLARAFALEPEVLLLDEPFSALDAPTRATLIDDFASILQDTPVTTVLVTHDRDEALRLGDRVVVLIAGRVRQVGTPGAVFGAPADEEVAGFVGVENVWPARLVRAERGVATYRIGPEIAAVEVDVATDTPPGRGLVAVRPEEVTVQPPAAGTPSSARNRLPARVRAIQPAGAIVRLKLDLAGEGGLTVVAAVTRPSLDDLDLDVGALVSVAFKATAAHVIPHD